MNAFSLTDQKTNKELDVLDDWEFAVIDLFLNAANSFGLPKSYGQIYGLLFCRDQSLSMDEVMYLLQISKGSASQGLRSLRQLGAISSVFEPGSQSDPSYPVLIRPFSPDPSQLFPSIHQQPY